MDRGGSPARCRILDFASLLLAVSACRHGRRFRIDLGLLAACLLFQMPQAYEATPGRRGPSGGDAALRRLGAATARAAGVRAYLTAFDFL